MNMANDGSLNRHGGQADMESNADERARERAEAVEERMRDALTGAAFAFKCPDCEAIIFRSEIESHMRGAYACELLRARAEAEVDRG
jgi:acetyl-CoA carboxylase beta subunit